MAGDRVPRGDRPGGRRGTTRGDQTQAGSGRSTPQRPKQRDLPRAAPPRRPSLRELAAERGRPRLVEPFAEATDETLRGPHPADRFLPIREDHARIEAALEGLRTASYAESERVERWTALATAIEVHLEAEEEHVYPHLAPIGRNDDLHADHAETRRLIGRLDAKQSDDAEFRDLLDALAAVIRRHVELEEGLVFPLAVQRLDAGNVDRVVAAFVRRGRQIGPAVEARRIRPGPPRR